MEIILLQRQVGQTTNFLVFNVYDSLPYEYYCLRGQLWLKYINIF